jgi:hypothetical protein
VDPLSLSALSASALSEGIKFLYGQAGDVLKRSRERKEGAASDEVGTPPEAARELLAGELAPLRIDFDAVDRLVHELRVLRADLGDYAQGIETVNPADTELVRAADAIRRLLEGAYGQRLTFAGEDRPESGPWIEGSLEVRELAGYAAGVRARLIEAGRIRGSLSAERVEQGGQAYGLDVDRITE